MQIEKIEYGLFSLTEIQMKGNLEWRLNMLDLHDTYGLPFDLIYLDVKESTDLIPTGWTSDNFSEFMNLFRKEQGLASI